MLRDYTGLREKEKKRKREEREKRGESEVAGRHCQPPSIPPTAHHASLSLSGLLSRSSRGPQAEIPFPGSSQGRSGHCWDV